MRRTLKRINGKHIVTVNGNEYVFRTLGQALTFIFLEY